MPSSLQKPVAPLVQKHARRLRPQWERVASAAREVVASLLEFSVAYRAAYAEVKPLGPVAVRALNEQIGLTDTAASRIRDIAAAQPQLVRHVAALPASVDAIHSVAVLAADEPRRFQRAITNGTITPSLTVRDARALQPVRRARTRTVSNSFAVGLHFNSAAAASTKVAALLLDPDVALARVPQAHVRDAVKSLLGKQQWQQVEHKLVG